MEEMANYVSLTEEDDESSSRIESIEVVIEKRLNSVISVQPKQLASWAGQSYCCIYRPPPWFVKAHNSSYEPEIISIGPFYHNFKSLKMIEEQKGKYLNALLEREKSSITMSHLVKMMVPDLVKKVRGYYSQDFSNLDDITFTEMLILDGCFIVELFRRASGVVLPVDSNDKDPILSIFHIFQSILKDLIKMGNQVPWFILEKLFAITGTDDNTSLSSMALSTFNIALNDSNEHIQMLQNLPVKEPKHILDFLRQSLISNNRPVSQPLENHGISDRRRKSLDIELSISQPAENHIHGGIINYGGGPTSVNGIQPISQLQEAGISVKPLRGRAGCSFLEVKFNHNGTLEMSPFMIDNFVSCLLFNGVAFEQCHAPSTKHLSSYVHFLDCLVNTSRDVKYLTDHKIIRKYSGTENEVAKLLNNMGKGLKIPKETCYLSHVFDQVNVYQQNTWHKQITNLYTKYFDSPWAIISVVAASFFFILAILQTVYTILGYYYKH